MKHFEGDGRERMDPTDVFPGTRPQPIRRSVANRLVEMFRDCGYSVHTRAGSTMWVLLRFCREANVPYTLKVVPSMGYEVKRLSWQEAHSPQKETKGGSSLKDTEAPHLALGARHV